MASMLLLPNRSITKNYFSINKDYFGLLLFTNSISSPPIGCVSEMKYFPRACFWTLNDCDFLNLLS